MLEARSGVVVVGSVNVDLVATVPALPRPGQTVLAQDYREFCGGKGGNQAVAAARLGQRVFLVGRVGNDAAAGHIRTALVDEGVDVSQLKTLSEQSTGRALVAVDEHAENSIIVIGGANAGLLPNHVEEAAALLQQAAVVVAQLEVPLEAVRAAGAHARGLFVLNPAPMQHLDEDLLRLVDVLVVNEGEFEAVSGHPVSDDEEAMSALLAGDALPDSVVVTVGSRGALVWQAGTLSSVPSPSVTVVDTTGAGDTFVGALADALARGEALLEAARWAVCAASLSTESLGATTGMPRSAQVHTLLAETATHDEPLARPPGRPPESAHRC